MKNSAFIKRLLTYLLLLTGILIYRPAVAQSPIAISGPDTVCVGDAPTYTFSPIGDSLIYTWTVTSQGTVINPGTTFIKVPVILHQGTIQGPTSVCPNTQYKYTLPQWPTTKFHWGVTGNATMQGTDQPNEIAVTTGNSGSFHIAVHYCNTLIACNGDAELTGTIKPAATISGAGTACINSSQTYTLVGASTADWTLTPPVGSPTVYNNVSSINPTFTQSGVYTLSITGNFCAPPTMIIRVLPQPPVPDQIVGDDSVCPGVPTLYTAQSPVAGTVFEWFVSSGTVNAGVGSNTYITFSSLPATIKLIRINKDAPHCISDTLAKVIYQEMPPITMTTNAPDTVCGSTQWHFDVNYYDADLYKWKVIAPNMGSVVSGKTTAHTQVLFNNPISSGQYVQVIVTVTKCYQEQSDTISIYVINTPNFTVIPGDTTICAGVSLPFNVSPTPTNYSSLTWDFGDGYTSGSASTSHSYTSTGAIAVYHPTLTIIHPMGCLSTVSLPAGAVTVKPTPVAYISPTSISYCGTFTDTLYATVTTGFGSTTNYHWYGPSSGAPNCGTCDIWNSIDTYGNYYVVVQNSNGCSGTSNVVEVTQNCGGGGVCSPQPSLVSSDSNFVSCATSQANITITMNGSTFVSGSWHFPAGATNTSSSGTTTATAQATFTVAGIYTFSYNSRQKR